MSTVQDGSTGGSVASGALDRPEGDGAARAERGPHGPAGLLCHKSNNSNERTCAKDGPRYRLVRIAGTDMLQSKGGGDQVWRKEGADMLIRLGYPTSAEAKAAYHLRRNVEAFIHHWGRNHCLFLTLTDEDDLHPRDFARRWNSFLVRTGGWIKSFIKVLEPQKKGRPHYHLLVAVSWDTLPDSFDWDALFSCQEEWRARGRSEPFRQFRDRYRASAASELVALWRFLRNALPRYRLGRAEVLPLRKGEEAVAEYIGKYLDGGLAIRRHSWKGCRRVEFDRRAKSAWIACTRVFAWNSPGARKWRFRLGELANVIGATEFKHLERLLGKRWAFRLRNTVILSDVVEWREFLQRMSERNTTWGVGSA